jgi:toxin ParE1/3/4
MKLVWSRAAMRDLDELAAYIGMESERASELVEGRIHKEAKLLSQFPRSGRIGRAPGTRERVVGSTRYIIVYRIVSGRIRVLRVYHGARKWPKQF